MEPTHGAGARADIACESARPPEPSGVSVEFSLNAPPSSPSASAGSMGGAGLTIRSPTLGTEYSPKRRGLTGCPACVRRWTALDESVSESPRSPAGSESPLAPPASPTLPVGGRHRDLEFTACDVARHKSVDDCWLIAHGVIYDATPFISQHPGGTESILRRGGKDATEDFYFHTRDGQKLWKKYRIGKLVPCTPRKGCLESCEVQ